MDIKGEITKVVNKVTSDKDILSKFQKNPEKTVEDIVGVDIPDGALDQIVAGVKAKVTTDKITDGLSALKKMF